MSWVCPSCTVFRPLIRRSIGSSTSTSYSSPCTLRYLSRNSAIAKGLRVSQREPSESYGDTRYGFPRREPSRTYGSPYALKRDERNANSRQQGENHLDGAKDKPRYGVDSTPTSTELRNNLDKSRLHQERPITVTRHRGAESRPRNLPEPIPYTTASSVFIVGARTITGALRSSRRKFYKLYLLSTEQDSPPPKSAPGATGRQRDQVARLAQTKGIPVERVDRELFLRIFNEASRTRSVVSESTHDGVILESSHISTPVIKSLESVHNNKTFAIERASQSAEEAEINGWETVVPFSSNGWRRPFLLWLHGVVDVQNVGAMVRTATYFGADAVLLSSRETATLSPGAQRASVGSADFMRTLQISGDPIQFMRKSQRTGWKFIASVAPTNGENFELLADMKLSPLSDHPTVLMMGSEMSGLDPKLIALADRRLSISGRSKLAELAGLDSLNVSVAAALLMERLLREPSEAEVEERTTIDQQRLF